MFTIRAVLEWISWHPLTWGALILALGVLTATQNLLLAFVVAFVSELAVFLYCLNNPDERHKALKARSDKLRAEREQQYEQAMEDLHPEVRQWMLQIFRHRKSLLEQINSPHVEESVRGFFVSVEDQIDEVTERAFSLAKRHHVMRQFLDQTSKHEIENHIKRIEKEKATAGADRIESLETALEIRSRELHHWSDIQAASKKIETQWIQLEATLSELKARVVKLQTSDTSERALAQQTLNTELLALARKIDTLEESVNEILTV